MVMLPLGEFMMGKPATEEEKVRQEEFLKKLENPSVYEFIADSIIKSAACQNRPLKNPKTPQELIAQLRETDEIRRKYAHYKIAITRQFAIGKYEVTNEEYAAFLKENPVLRTPENIEEKKTPITNINWREAKAYTNWLSKKTGHSYRLPSEAEWEYAARAGTQTQYHWGNDIGVGNAHCSQCGTRWDKENEPIAVGQFPPNNFGLHDTSGNVSEWTEDCANWSNENAPADGKIRTSGNCDCRITKGGSYILGAIQSHRRDAQEIESGLESTGFRVAREK